MKTNIYNGIENLTKKEIIQARATEKRNVTAELANFANSIDFAFKQLTATGSVARNSANACKGLYKTAINVVANCYPYQTATGELCRKTRNGFVVRKLNGRGVAGSVVAMSVKNFIDWKTGRISELVAIVEPVTE